MTGLLFKWGKIKVGMGTFLLFPPLGHTRKKFKMTSIPCYSQEKFGRIPGGMTKYL